MNKPLTLDDFALAKFGVGQPVPRNEDPILVRGEGRYTDDMVVPGQAYGVFVRSPHAHGIIRGIDADAAKAMAGVLGVFTGQDIVAAGYGLLKCNFPGMNRDGTPLTQSPRPALPVDRVRYVGEAVALVVAESLAVARDAAEAVVLDVDPLPAVTTMEDAIAEGAPQLHDGAPGNVSLDYLFGDPQAVDAAFAKAAHVTSVDIVNSRIVVNPLEPRAAIGEYDREAQRWILRSPSQGVFGLRRSLAEVLRAKPEEVRVITGHVGGSFGMKAPVFPEYVAILHAARTLERPVKWTDTRSESFVADHHGRDSAVRAELALDRDGRFLAVRLTGLGNMGGYLTSFGPMMPSLGVAKNAIGTYRTPLMQVSTRCVFTNTAPVGPYRGAGRPEGNYYMERLIDTAARELGIDPIELRRRNQIHPEELPYATPVGTTYDSGDFPGLLARAVEAADWDGFPDRRRESLQAGKLRGRGIGCYLEVTAPPANEMGGIHFEADGTVTIVTGTLDYGQGHWTPLAQILTSRLGVPFESIRLVQGDSDRLVAGGGTGGSKSIMASGAAVIEASDLVIAAGRRIAAHLLEAGEVDVEFEAGRFTIAGTDRGIGIMELAARLREGVGLPADLPATLDVDHIHEAAPAAFPNGCHIAEVEVDPETGVTEVVRYTMVNDFGTLVNPMLVEGQLHGGVMQGIGQALLESTKYDDAGQLVTGSFLDYALPRAADAPDFRFESRGIPTKGNLVGAKGCGEAGCAGALPAVMNAVVDALSERGIRHIDMPATPPRVWTALQAAQPVVR